VSLDLETNKIMGHNQRILIQETMMKIKPISALYLAMLIGTAFYAQRVGSSEIVFYEDWETGSKSQWDSSYNIYQVTTTGGINNYSLRLNHTAGSNNSGSVEKGFADIAVAGYGNNLKGPRTNLATIEAKVKFSTNLFPTDGSTKILTLESWLGDVYPSTSEKSFQAIVEVASDGQLVVTIKREGFDFYTRYPTNPIKITPNQTYKIKLQIQLDQPYTAANGVLKFWVDDVLQIDRNNEDFILSSRGSDLPKGLNMLLIAGYDGGSGSPDTKSQYWDDLKLIINGNDSLSAPPNLKIIN
jgi:hypothetical protein